MLVPKAHTLTGRISGAASRPLRVVLVGLAVCVAAVPGYGQDARTVTATRVPAGFYCGHVELSLYTQNAGLSTTQFRAGDYNAAESPARYYIDPGLDGAITGAWYVPTANLDNLSLFRKLNVYPDDVNGHQFVLEALAVPDVAPGQMTIEVHLACRPGG